MGSEIHNLLLKTRQKHFELNDKPQKLLSRQLKGEQAKSAIYKIQSKNGQILTDQKDNQCFREFYSNLYASASTATNRDYFQFFDSLNLPQLNDRNQKFLERDFSVVELNEAIKTFPTGKCPGPDGFGAEFYQAFKDILIPYLLRMINDSVTKNRLPQSLYKANMSVIKKWKRSHRSC